MQGPEQGREQTLPLWSSLHPRFPPLQPPHPLPARFRAGQTGSGGGVPHENTHTFQVIDTDPLPHIRHLFGFAYITQSVFWLRYTRQAHDRASYGNLIAVVKTGHLAPQGSVSCFNWPCCLYLFYFWSIAWNRSCRKWSCRPSCQRRQIIPQA